MTTLIEQLPTAAFAPANITVPPLPVLTGTTVVWCYIGGSTAQSPNLMTGAPFTAIGAPTYQPSYGSFIGGTSMNALDTGLKDDVKTFSAIMVSRYTGGIGNFAHSPIGNNDTGTLFGVAVALQQNTSTFGVGTNNTGINRTITVTGGVSQWKMYGVAFADSAAPVQDLWNLTDGTTDHFVGTGTRILAATTNWFIGANPRNTIGTQSGDNAFIGLIKGQAITLTQANQIAANVRVNLINRGFTPVV